VGGRICVKWRRGHSGMNAACVQRRGGVVLGVVFGVVMGVALGVALGVVFVVLGVA